MFPQRALAHVEPIPNAQGKSDANNLHRALPVEAETLFKRTAQGDGKKSSGKAEGRSVEYSG